MIATEKLDAILEIITEAIRDRLASPDRTRFIDAMKLCNQAQTLLRLTGKRVKDFPGAGAAGVGLIQGAIGGYADLLQPDDGGEGPANMGMVQGAAFGGLHDQAGIMREIVMMMGPHFEQMTRQAEAREGASLADQLNSLLTARDEMLASGTPDDHRRAHSLDKQIDQLVQRLEAKHDNVVPADPVRGHPTEDQGTEDHAGDLREAEPTGDRGDADAPRAGGEERVGIDVDAEVVDARELAP
jgi:hypothetical protein